MSATPILLDTDMGLDDAAALILALSDPRIDLRAIVATGGNVPLAQAELNIGRLLRGTGQTARPIIGRGLDQDEAALERAHHVHGDDGLGGVDLPPDPKQRAALFLDVYRDAVRGAAGKLEVVAIGPLTTLAAAMDDVEIRAGIARLHIMGGAVWRRGNVTEHAEFNFYRDPAAASRALTCGLPITLTPLDVTETVHVDESHIAHLAASAARPTKVLASILDAALSRSLGDGHFIVLHDAVSVARILWPELFERMHVRIEVVTAGPQAGRSRPALGGAAEQQIEVLSAVNGAELIDRMWEALCHERFIV